ncbi:Uncharacterised protein [Mycobacteroides abscessus subsp. massiliense]|nr:Uncharacterised protein [Mycobacteroides abscessus subsp. massiliense]
MRVAVARIADGDIPSSALPAGPVDPHAHRGGQQDRLAELHVVTHGVGNVALDVSENCCSSEHPVSNRLREAQCLGADRRGVDRVVVTTHRRVATNLSTADPQCRVRWRQLDGLGRLRLGPAGEAGALLAQECHGLLPHRVGPDGDVGEDVHQQPLAVLAQVLRPHLDVDGVGRADGAVLGDVVLQVHRADRREREVQARHQ